MDDQGWQEPQATSSKSSSAGPAGYSYQPTGYIEHWQPEPLRHKFDTRQMDGNIPMQHVPMAPYIYTPAWRWNHYLSSSGFVQYFVPRSGIDDSPSIAFRGHMSMTETSHSHDYSFYTNQNPPAGRGAAEISCHHSSHRQNQTMASQHDPGSKGESKGMTREIIIIDLTESLPGSIQSSPEIVLRELEKGDCDDEDVTLLGIGVAPGCSHDQRMAKSKQTTDYSAIFYSGIEGTSADMQSMFDTNIGRPPPPNINSPPPNIDSPPPNIDSPPPIINSPEHQVKMMNRSLHSTAGDMHLTLQQQTPQASHTRTRTPPQHQQTLATRIGRQGRQRMQASDFTTPDHQRIPSDDLLDFITVRRKAGVSSGAHPTYPSQNNTQVADIENFKQNNNEVLETSTTGIFDSKILNSVPGMTDRTILCPKTRLKPSNLTFYENNVSLASEHKPQLEHSTEPESAKESSQSLRESVSLCLGYTQKRSSGTKRNPYEILGNSGTKRNPHEILENSGTKRNPHEILENLGTKRNPYEILENSGTKRDPHEILENSGTKRNPHEILESGMHKRLKVSIRGSVVATIKGGGMATPGSPQVKNRGATEEDHEDDPIIICENIRKPIQEEAVNPVALPENIAMTPVPTFNFCWFYETSKCIYFSSHPFDTNLDSYFPAANEYPFPSTKPHVSLYEVVLKTCSAKDPDGLLTLGRLAKAAWLGMNFAVSDAQSGGDALFEFYSAILAYVWNSLRSGLHNTPTEERQKDTGKLLKKYMPHAVQQFNDEEFMFAMQARLDNAMTRMQHKATLAAMISRIDGWGMNWWLRVHAVLNGVAETQRDCRVHVLWTKEVLENTLRLAELASYAIISVEEVWLRITDIALHENRYRGTIVISNGAHIGLVISELQLRYPRRLDATAV